LARAATGRRNAFDAFQRTAAALVDLEVVDAEIVPGVEVLGARDARLLAGRDERLENVPAQAVRLHPPFAAGAVEFGRAAVMVFAALEQRQHGIPAPAGVADGRRPAVVILALAAHVDHAVDRRAAAEHAPARIQKRTAVEPRLLARVISPVRARIADAIQIADRDVDPVVVVAAARFEQQHANVRIGRQPIGEHAARRAGADDHVVVAARARRFTLPCHNPMLADWRGRAGSCYVQ
jgi:hypothetical protein